MRPHVKILAVAIGVVAASAAAHATTYYGRASQPISSYVSSPTCLDSTQAAYGTIKNTCSSAITVVMVSDSNDNSGPTSGNLTMDVYGFVPSGSSTEIQCRSNVQPSDGSNFYSGSLLNWPQNGVNTSLIVGAAGSFTNTDTGSQSVTCYVPQGAFIMSYNWRNLAGD